MDDHQKLIEGLQAAWKREIAGVKTYRELARRAPSQDQRDILNRLADAEERHAETWTTRLKELGSTPPEFRESLRDRIRRWVLVQAGTEAAVRYIESTEDSDSAAYKELAASTTDAKDRAAVRATETEERAHGKVLNDMSQPAPLQVRLESMMKTEKWHVRGGGGIGQAIYGMNDGLGAAFGVVSGVAGATSENAQFVLISGIAAAIASALSMGSGAYLAAKSEREVYEAELERERREIETDPEQEREEMQLFYELKGFKTEEAKMLALRLAEQPEQMLKTLAHEELGLSESTFPNPWRAAISATISTALGAFIPVLPFFFLTGIPALATSFVISTAAHFAVGASKVIVTGRSWWKSGAEMMVVGLGEAITTYIIGVLIGGKIG
ncbi:MAG: VIT1/CCC1 transporter family protein [Chloroflexota bacterium]|nr:VIT1/CCC1 transporter family protein [Chloroflexota bacterium]